MNRSLALLLLLVLFVTSSFGDVHFQIRKAKKGKKAKDFGASQTLLSLSNTSVTPAELRGGKLSPGHRQWAAFQLTNALTSNPAIFLPSDVGTLDIQLIAVNVDASGKTTPLYTIELDGATIIEDEKGTTKSVEKLQITFQSIEWTWNDGGAPFKDTWLPVGVSV